MIVDTSALIAILRQEPDAKLYTDAIAAASVCRISAGTLLEASIVVDTSQNPITRRRLDDIVQRAGMIVEPVTEQQAVIGRFAYREFGKRSGSAAKLNFGDCFAYALAKLMDEPILFKGNDFSATDLESAL